MTEAAALAALFGLLIGSFLNVCIHRWPLELSVVKPRSRCPGCEHLIAWYDNIPVLSYLLLGARCRHCGARIHWRYPVVELLTAAAFAWSVWHSGLTLAAAKNCIFAAIVIGLIFSDLETLLLPDEFTIGGLVVGLLFSCFVPVPDSTFGLLAGLTGFMPGPRLGSFCEAAFGAIVPAGTLWILGWAWEKLRHKEDMLGLGDVKMIAMAGSFLGIRGTLLTLMAGSLTGAVVGLIFILTAKKDWSTYPLPFGTFLGAAALFAAMGGADWYTGLLFR